MKPPREIEAKYDVASAALFAQLLALPAIGPFALCAAPAPELQQNTYFDTADRRLRAGLHSFRIRAVDGRYTATLKGPASTIDGATVSRAELEAPAPSRDPEALPPGELRAALLAVTGGAALLPTLTMQTTRQLIDARRADLPVLEIALDTVVIAAGARRGGFHELEIELLPAGAPDDLALLSRLLAARFPLTPQPLSKLARGLAFLEGSS
jgi:inorganic triphosphatase YgiF